MAINKVDLPTSDPDRIKRQLAERDVLLEDWGGQVACAEISAKTGLGIDKLLELVLLESELLELKAAADKRARGTIIEAQLDKGRKLVASALQKGFRKSIARCYFTKKYFYASRGYFLRDDLGTGCQKSQPAASANEKRTGT